LFIAAVAGLLAGAVHVLSGPDHLAALAPIASDARQRSWLAGALWGLGHASGVLVVGILALLFRNWLPIDLLSSWSERLVGIVLIAIGVWGLHRAIRWRVHTRPHSHGPLTHSHFHAPPHTHTHAAFGVGILHGLAGSSHFLAVLPALALPGMAASLSYLSGYGAGTVVAMSGFATVIGFIAGRARHNGPTAARWLLSACSTAALIVGAAWLTF
jgi:hypothetical protein